MRRTTVIKDHKKDVNATLDFLDTVIKGHWLACACDILGVKSLDNHLKIPYLKKKGFVESIAQKVVHRMSVVDSMI